MSSEMNLPGLKHQPNYLQVFSFSSLPLLHGWSKGNINVCHIELRWLISQIVYTVCMYTRMMHYFIIFQSYIVNCFISLFVKYQFFTSYYFHFEGQIFLFVTLDSCDCVIYHSCVAEFLVVVIVLVFNFYMCPFSAGLGDGIHLCHVIGASLHASSIFASVLMALVPWQ